jgi:hypothetical protein
MSLVPFNGTVSNPVQSSVSFNNNNISSVGSLTASTVNIINGVSDATLSMKSATGPTGAFSFVGSTSKFSANYPMIYTGASGASQFYDPVYNKAPTQTYGSFSSTATQTVIGADTPTVITFNTTDIASGVSRGGTGAEGQIIFSEGGVYKVLCSLVLDHAGSSASNCYFWWRKNGTDIANSGSDIEIRGDAIMGTVELIVSVNANQYLEIVFASSESTTAIRSQTASTSPYIRPAVPSVIATVVKLSQ